MSVPQVIILLNENASAEQIARYLGEVVMERIGLSKRRRRVNYCLDTAVDNDPEYERK